MNDRCGTYGRREMPPTAEMFSMPCMPVVLAVRGAECADFRSCLIAEKGRRDARQA